MKSRKQTLQTQSQVGVQDDSAEEVAQRCL